VNHEINKSLDDAAGRLISAAQSEIRTKSAQQSSGGSVDQRGARNSSHQAARMARSSKLSFITIKIVLFMFLTRGRNLH
jgi:hypothetical protein